MIVTSFRPLTPEEKASVENNLKTTSVRRDAVFAAILTFFLALGIALLVTERFVRDPLASQVVPAGLALVLAIAVYRRASRESWKTAHAEALREDLESNQAEVARYKAKDAICVEEFEDEGSSYFVQLADDRVLFLSGQYLYELEDDHLFPNTDFVIVRTPGTRLLLDFQCLGSYFPPSYTRTHFTDEDYRQDRVPEDGTVLDMAFESLYSRPAG